MQIIVVDDGSIDGTAEWLRSQADVLVVEGNGWGKPWGVNKALELADGKYLRFLDSDDWLAPGANEVQFEIAERERSDVVVAGYNVFSDEEFVKAVPWIESDDFIAQQLGEVDSSTYIAYLFRRDFVRDIPHRTHFPSSDFASRDDRCYVLEVALKHPRVSVCAEPSVCVRHHTKGRLQFHGALRGTGTHLQHLYIYRQIIRLLEDGGELSERRRRAAAKILWPLAHQIGYTHLAEATEVAAWLFELYPDFEVPQQGLLGGMYRHLGFRKTEQLLLLRRLLVGAFKQRFVRAARRPGQALWSAVGVAD